MKKQENKNKKKIKKRKKENKLAKAQTTRKSPGSLGLKKFEPGKLWVFIGFY